MHNDFIYYLCLMSNTNVVIIQIILVKKNKTKQSDNKSLCVYVCQTGDSKHCPTTHTKQF